MGDFFREAFLRFLPVAGIAVAFGVVYWLIRRRIEARAAAKRKKWIAERRFKRHGEP